MGSRDLKALELKETLVSLVSQAFKDTQAFRDLQDSKETMEILDLLDQRVKSLSTGLNVL